jgi:hypothetical protein
MAVEKNLAANFRTKPGFSIGMVPLANTAFEALLLKSARSKWAKIDQHMKALRLSHRAELFIFGPLVFVLFSRVYTRARS